MSAISPLAREPLSEEEAKKQFICIQARLRTLESAIQNIAERRGLSLVFEKQLFLNYQSGTSLEDVVLYPPGAVDITLQVIVRMNYLNPC